MILSDEELTVAATREMARANGTYLSLELDISEAMGLLGTIQLAMRHPGYGENASEAMREIARRIEWALAHVGPAMEELCRRGWQKKGETVWNS